eukprot:GHVL01039176.1.p1 GENE.GHVL01039176.1~~GHVL01039176.1.p1  ORF type:complete len:441 (-),score=130.47 GHVL01039176.1:1015-2337(-)
MEDVERDVVMHQDGVDVLRLDLKLQNAIRQQSYELSLCLRIIENSSCRSSFTTFCWRWREVMNRLLLLLRVSAFAPNIKEAISESRGIVTDRMELREIPIKLSNICNFLPELGDTSSVFPDPMPAVDGAIESLVSSTYPSLPALTSTIIRGFTAKSRSSGHVYEKISINQSERLKIRLQTDLKRRWLQSEASLVENLIFAVDEGGLVQLYCEGEFKITLIYDLHRWCVVRANILAGQQLGFCSSKEQTNRFIEELVKLSVDPHVNNKSDIVDIPWHIYMGAHQISIRIILRFLAWQANKICRQRSIIISSEFHESIINNNKNNIDLNDALYVINEPLQCQLDIYYNQPFIINKNKKVLLISFYIKFDVTKEPVYNNIYTHVYNNIYENDIYNIVQVYIVEIPPNYEDISTADFIKIKWNTKELCLEDILYNSAKLINNNK